MLHRGVSLLCLCIFAMQLVQDTVGLPVDPEIRAHLEAKVMSAMSLKDIEEMVENDDRVVNSPKSKIIIIPKPKNTDGLFGEDDRDAIIIHRKPKKSLKNKEAPEFRYPDFDYEKDLRRSSYDRNFDFDKDLRRSSYDRNFDFDKDLRRSSYDRNFNFDSEFRHEDDFPFFKISDFETARSSPVHSFYESIVAKVMDKNKFGLSRDPMEYLDIAASESVPAYKPRFDYDAYSKDPVETKLQGKPYWRDAPERRDESVDENGCRTVVKRIVDPENEKKDDGGKAKSVIITKECEYPNLNGPDAKIAEARPLRQQTSRYDSEHPIGYANYDDQSHEKSRPEQLNFQKPDSRDSLAPDYIDKMLEQHFKSFPGFTSPLTSFRGYQERFKLRAPEEIKNIKPTVGVQTYEYTHPKSGFEDERRISEDSESDDTPRTFDIKLEEDYPEHHAREPQTEYDNEDKAKSSDSKDPKMLKKSFAYYRKDNPKTDPNDHQFAEEYAQGNYRSFSSSYDSEKDGPKKKE